jgi:hypothetical protein
VAFREPPFLPFGPKETPRPWTGRAPLPPSKKKLPEFDSFKLPPRGKKGVKPVQSPGPFLAGSGGPRYSTTREEILGEPLTKEEVGELIKGSLKVRRQLNMGILEEPFFFPNLIKKKRLHSPHYSAKKDPILKTIILIGYQTFHIRKNDNIMLKPLN